MEELKQYFENQGFVQYQGSYCGDFEGYPIIVYLNGNDASCTIKTVFTTSNSLHKSVIKRMKKQSPVRINIQKGAAGQEHVITAIFTGKQSMLNDWLEVVRFISRTCREEGNFAPSMCCICNNGEADSFGVVRGNYNTVHQSCYANSLHDTVLEAEKRLERGNYSLAILGAFIGAFVGAIPTFITIVFMGYIYSLVCALIPLASFFGYILFKGKRTKAMLPVIFLFSIAQGFVIEMALFYKNVVDYYNIWPYVIDVVELYFRLYTPSDFLESTYKVFIFILLGFFYCFRLISQTDAGVINTAKADMDTLRKRGM